MIIKSIKIEGFRNIEKEHIFFDDKYNYICGDNASGKTSILESIYFCAFGKSFRSRDSDLIHYDREYCRVEANFVKNEISQKIEYAISRAKGKWFRINSKNAKNYLDIIANINMVIFCPDDLKIIKDGPSVRRMFMNKEISGINKIYYSDYADYNNILKNRNYLLKGTANNLELEVWNEKLAEYGSRIIMSRLKFIDVLSYISAKIHQEISEGREELRIGYKSGILKNMKDITKETVKERFHQLLEEQKEFEKKRGYTFVGPHTEDFDVYINGKNARIYSSQGQQRTAALSLKLAEVELIKKETGNNPIVLLDDIMSELDKKRRQKIKGLFHNSQIFITDSEVNDEENKIVVNDGKIIKCG